ncbi:T9SS type A sorting domain-containing protein [Cytophagaceae bacterium ABcell3]|nr:T9SS type A sorting domain-containing protein [Cytophagaceae bacterium ABcell3]
MKKTYLILTLTFLAVFANSVYAQKLKKGKHDRKEHEIQTKSGHSVQQKTAIVESRNAPDAEYELPQSSMDSVWVDDQWELSSRTFYEYDESRRITTQTIQILVDDEWLNEEQVLYTYNDQGETEEIIWQDWEDDDWENRERYLFLRNEQGDLSEESLFDWDGNDWTYTSSRQHSYTYQNGLRMSEEVVSFDLGAGEFQLVESYEFDYDNQDRVITELAFGQHNDDWEPSARTLFHYANNEDEAPELIEEEYYDFEEDSWISAARFRDISFVTWTNDPGEYELESFYYDAWNAEEEEYEQVYRGTRTEQEHGSFTYIEEVWLDGEWENDFRYSEHYDQHGHYRGFVEEEWNGDWNIVASSLISYYFDEAGELLHIITRFWDPDEEDYVNDEKIGFREGVVASIRTQTKTLDLTAYPNPGTGIYTLKTEEKATAISIADMKGHQVNALVSQEDEGYTIDIQNLPDGIYLVTFMTEDHSQVLRLIKQ